MKISLVVASGVRQGKVIPIPGVQFLIGRDEDCHLRPASPAISKKHCLLQVHDGKAFARDLGSTNGTFVNDEQISGEHELVDGDRLRVGPLDFFVTLAAGGKTDSTPLPDALKAVNKPGEPIPAESDAEDQDQIAAMMLGMGDDSDEVPGGSTIMELPSVEGGPEAAAKAEEKKRNVPTAAESSAAASEILRRYMKRPR